MESGISGIFCTDPLCAINLFFNSSFQIPNSIKSFNKLKSKPLLIAFDCIFLKKVTRWSL